MLKKTMTYKNFDGEDVTEDFYFNLTKAELMKMNFDDGGMSLADKIEKITKIPVKQLGGKFVIDTFEEILSLSYGERTDDGKFVKSPEAFKQFMATEAYSELFFDMVTSAEKSAEFINAVMPANLAEEAKKLQDRITNEAPLQDEIKGQQPEEMTEAELLANLEVPETVAKTGLTDDEIRALKPSELAGMPREVLIRAYQLKNQK